ncbi:MAG: CCA tRNA nucleotidyltransferase [Patescibacteria group bacterium]
MDVLNIHLPQSITEFLAIFKDNGMEVYVVGGAVRDLIIGKTTSDWDFTTNATPDKIQKLFPDSYYNNTYGTVTVKWPDDKNTLLLEVTPYRKEGKYEDGRHPSEVIWANNIEEDLARRDFTINAMAYDGVKLIDPFGGLDDLRKGIIKAVGKASDRFEEDALRLLRAVRFAAQLGFIIDDDTRSAIKSKSSLITQVSWERIKEEFFKLLSSDHPAEGILFLKNTGLLHYILPELEKCFAIPQKSPNRHHIYDVGTHLIMSLKNCNSKNPVTRFATLIHDIGKERTFHKDPRSQLITFYNHEVVGTNMAEVIADRFRLSNEEKDLLIKLVANHQFVVSEDLTDNAIRRFIRNVGKENLEEMFALRRADRLGGAASETSWRTELFKKRVAELLIEPFTVKDLKVDGHDVMQTLAIKPSRQVGDILDKLFEKVINKEIANERDVLIAEIKNLKS